MHAISKPNFRSVFSRKFPSLCLQTAILFCGTATDSTAVDKKHAVEPSKATIKLPKGTRWAQDDSNSPFEVTIPPYSVSLVANPDGSLRSLWFGSNVGMRPKLETNAAAVVAYQKAHAAEKLRRAEAARRIGEDKLFARLNASIAKYLKVQAELQPDREKLLKELRVRIYFSKALKYRYLVKTADACRQQVVKRDGRNVVVPLLKNIEFVRPSAKPELPPKKPKTLRLRTGRSGKN
jgi:hypothetical protein